MQNRPGSDLDGLVRVWPTHLVWKQVGVQESFGPVSGRTQPGFGQTDPVRKQAGVQESSGPLLANAFHLIRTGCEWDPAYLLGWLKPVLN